MAGGFFSRLAQGMKKTRDGLAQKIDGVIAGFKKIDDDFLEELEEALILADIGVTASQALIEELKARASEQKITDTAKVKEILRDIITDMMTYEPRQQDGKLLLMMVGVNGVGKTTAIGKLSALYAKEGKKVMLAAGDTFRAAAAEQLEEWGRRTGAAVVRHGEGADPSAVIFDAIQSAKAKNADVLICDTAGRLQTKKNLMDELEKMGRVIAREFPEAHKETYLVLDATTGQNAVSQARIFNESVKIDAIILTKMDGTAKGGIVLSIRKELGIPVRYIGVGEGVDDLQEFDAREFAEAVL
ncbi:signal recognition particle-docking protein FtsY [Clostridia bacterium OttesenSCG-928-F22]|nr:signal recognition particle-docking protein FtsY [Clostridia bacterium OttesenSCG-928-F22]